MHTKEVAMPPISRRTFLTTAATAAGSVALGCGDHPMIAPTRAQQIGGLLPDPASCGIEHVVVFMMENRSFDHLLGWLPGKWSNERFSIMNTTTRSMHIGRAH